MRNHHYASIISAKHEQGFSLFEMIMVIVIISIIAALGANMMSNGFRAYFMGKDLTELDWQSRLAMERLTRDLRLARSASVADLTIAPASQISFTNSSGATISYVLNGTTLERNAQPLADGVATLVFTYLRNDGKTTTLLESEVYYISVEVGFVNNVTTRNVRATLHPRGFL